MMAFWRKKDRDQSATDDNLVQAKCTYCGGTEFYEGPSGGMSQNILCANPDCRHWFNWHGGIIPMDDLHRIEPSAEEKAAKANAMKLERDAEFAKRMNTGLAYYREHGSIAALRQHQLEQRSTYPRPEQIDEICGFIMGMADHIQSLKETKVTLTDADMKLRQYREVAELARYLYDRATLHLSVRADVFVGWAIDWLRHLPNNDPPSTEGENFIRDVFYKRE